MEQEPTNRPSPDAFAAYFAGEIALEEKEAVDQWVGGAEANREEFEQLRLVWQDFGSLRMKEVQVDKDAAFQQVKQKKEALDQPLGWAPVWRVAVAVLLLVTVSWWLWKPTTEVIVLSSTGVQAITLSDGSMVTLNDQALLTYPEQFGGKERELQLIGEAFFSVEEDINRPFHIQAGPVTVTVLGTEFNVIATEESVEVAVSSGRVEVSSGHVVEVIRGGQRILVHFENDAYTVGTNSISGTEFYWVDQKLVFKGVELMVVLAELESIFDVQIEVSDEAILACLLQASFEGQSFEEMIEIIALTQNLEVSSNGTNYRLTGAGCDN